VLTPPGGSALTTVLSYPANSNRLSSTSVGGVTTRTFAYDAEGNLVTQIMGPQRLASAYNQRNRPVIVTRTGGGTQVSAYLFNALEQLVQCRTNAPGGPSSAQYRVAPCRSASLGFVTQSVRTCPCRTSDPVTFSALRKRPPPGLRRHPVPDP
jgi:YD repeat-containing protein